MNARYKPVGIGVWVSGGRVRLVVDFYAPLTATPPRVGPSGG